MGLRESIQVDPFDPRAHRFLARVSVELGQELEAREAYQRALSLDGQHYETWCGFAALLMKTGSEDALGAWISAKANAPNLVERSRIDDQIRRVRALRVASGMTEADSN